MKNFFILSALLVSSICFGQFVDLNKKQTFERFKNSSIRKELGLKLKDFNYSTFVKKAKEKKVPISKMVVLNKPNEINSIHIIKDGYSRRNRTDASYCIFCQDILYHNINQNVTEQE